MMETTNNTVQKHDQKRRERDEKHTHTHTQREREKEKSKHMIKTSTHTQNDSLSLVLLSRYDTKPRSRSVYRPKEIIYQTFFFLRRLSTVIDFGLRYGA